MSCACMYPFFAISVRWSWMSLKVLVFKDWSAIGATTIKRKFFWVRVIFYPFLEILCMINTVWLILLRILSVVVSGLLLCGHQPSLSCWRSSSTDFCAADGSASPSAGCGESIVAGDVYLGCISFCFYFYLALNDSPNLYQKITSAEICQHHPLIHLLHHPMDLNPWKLQWFLVCPLVVIQMWVWVSLSLKTMS